MQAHNEDPQMAGISADVSTDASTGVPDEGRQDDPVLSVIVAMEGDGQGSAALLEGYLEALSAHGTAFEMICIFDHAASGLGANLAELAARWPVLLPIAQRPWGGEDTALKVGIDRARGATLLTLPGWSEIAPGEIGKLIDSLGTDDMVIGKRTGLRRSGPQRLRMGLTHGLIRLLFGQKFGDVFCRARAGSAEMFRKIADLGVRQHFLPLVAVSEGYRVHEIDVAPEANGTSPPAYIFKPLAHISALVDILTLYVGLKFLRRPLRFFGAVGLPLLLLGGLLLTYLVVSRLVFGEALADRPALVFSVLMIVLGIQIIALGLIGEIVIFSSTRRMRTYEIEEIIRGRPEDIASGQTNSSKPGSSKADPATDGPGEKAPAKTGAAKPKAGKTEAGMVAKD